MLVSDNLDPVYGRILKTILEGKEFGLEEIKDLHLSDEQFDENGIYGFNLFSGTIDYLGYEVEVIPKFTNGTFLFLVLKDDIFTPSHEEIQNQVDKYRFKKARRKEMIVDGVLGVFNLVD